MIEVILTYPTPEGSQEIAIENERTSFGRGSDSDLHFPDDGLSRLHATFILTATEFGSLMKIRPTELLSTAKKFLRAERL